MLINKLKNYVAKNLGLKIISHPLAQKTSLPIFLREKYHFNTCKLGDIKCVIMQPKDAFEPTPGELKNDTRLIENKFGYETIYLQSGISSYNRDRLISYKVAFIIPDNQMYLPFLGCDLREHFKRLKFNDDNKFRTSTQAIFLYLINNKADKAEITLSSLFHSLGYSKMTISRAFNKFERAKLGKVFVEGRERILRLEFDKRALWEKAQKFLVSPIKKRIFIEPTPEIRPKYVSGLSALAKYSMLAPPNHRIYAISNKDLKELREHQSYFELASKEQNCIELEIWKYAPELLTQDSLVDKFSLYLSQKDTDDERIEMALDELLEKIEW